MQGRGLVANSYRLASAVFSAPRAAVQGAKGGGGFVSDCRLREENNVICGLSDHRFRWLVCGVISTLHVFMPNVASENICCEYGITWNTTSAAELIRTGVAFILTVGWGMGAGAGCENHLLL